MMEFTYQGVVRQGFGFYNPNHAAALICAILPFTWMLIKGTTAGIPSLLWLQRGVAVVAMAGLLVMLAFTFSRTGIVVLAMQGIVFSFQFLVFRKRDSKGGQLTTKNYKLKTLLPLLLFIAPSIAIFGVVGVFSRFGLDASTLNRLTIWLAGLKLTAANPLCGVGVGHSGLLATLFLLPEGIVCRTLVNSHLTLLAECGVLLGFAYLWGVGYALLNGIRKPAVWVSFMGLCVSATMASVFDWDVLSDFSGYGGLPLHNFILSYALLAMFIGLGVCLCRGRVRKRPLMISGAVALACAVSPCLLGKDPRLPGIQGPYLVKAGENPILAYHDGSFDLKTVVGILEQEGGGYRVSLKPSLDIDPRLPHPERVMLFGDCAEFASYYARSRVLLVSPSEEIGFPENTSRLFLRRFPRRLAFESKAQDRGIPIEYY